MNIPKLLRTASASVLIALALSANALATDVLNVNSAVSLSDPTQLGRLSRNGIPQDWANTETFPGIVNATTAYHYTTFTISAAVAANGPFMQISLLDLGPAATQGNIFVSAYANAYLPNSSGTGNLGFNTNWLGDSGFSPNNFGNAVFFQVLVPAGASLVIVINNTAAGNVGVGQPFKLLVESFSDNQFSDARVSAVPEGGATALLLGIGLAGLCLSRRVLAARA